MKQVKTAQIFDVKTAGEIIQQFDRCKLVKAECNMPAVTDRPSDCHSPDRFRIGDPHAANVIGRSTANS